MAQANADLAGALQEDPGALDAVTDDIKASTDAVGLAGVSGAKGADEVLYKAQQIEEEEEMDDPSSDMKKILMHA